MVNIDVPLLDRVLASIADCPRTANEVAKDIGVSREDAARAITTLRRQRKVTYSALDPDNKHQVYEVQL